MKTILKSLLFATLVVFTISCGGKKDDQDFGKKETTEETKPDNSAFPLAEKGKEKNASIATFLKGDEEAIVDPTQYEVMKTNFALTKTFTDEERLALEQYVLSQGK